MYQEIQYFSDDRYSIYNGKEVEIIEKVSLDEYL